MMEKPGMTVSRWIDGVLEKNELIDQDNNLRAVVFWGHAPNSQTRGKEMLDAMKKLDTLVVIDPYPSATAAMAAMATPVNQLGNMCRKRAGMAKLLPNVVKPEAYSGIVFTPAATATYPSSAKSASASE